MKSFIIDVENFFEGHLLRAHGGDEVIESNGCTYNFNRDTDIRCLTNALKRALNGGTKELAFDVYFAFAEIFKIFGNSYNRIDILIETLTGGKELPERHSEIQRNPFVHPVYIFAMGLVFYAKSKEYKKTYTDFYGLSDTKEAKVNFLYNWGMCTLFHSVGHRDKMIRGVNPLTYLLMLFNAPGCRGAGTRIVEKPIDDKETEAFKFLCEIEDEFPKNDVYLSAYTYASLYKFALAINESYSGNCEKHDAEGMKKNFLDLTLEYKLSNIAQVRSYAKKLDKIHCFLSDTEMNYERVEHLSDDELDLLAREEHIRWVQEKLEMGWRYDTDYRSRAEREQKRISKDIIPYDELDDEQKAKDIFPMKNMIKILNEFKSGVYIYRHFKFQPHKKIAFSGHVTLGDSEKIYQSILGELKSLKKLHPLEAECMFAYGSDILFAKAAIELGIPISAVLPKPVNQFLSQDFLPLDGNEMMELLAQTARCDICPHPKPIIEHLLRSCDILLCIRVRQELPLDYIKSKATDPAIYFANKNNIEVIMINI